MIENCENVLFCATLGKRSRASVVGEHKDNESLDLKQIRESFERVDLYMGLTPNVQKQLTERNNEAALTSSSAAKESELTGTSVFSCAGVIVRGQTA